MKLGKTRLLAGLLAFLLCASMFAACSEKTESEETAGDPAADKTEPAVEEEEADDSFIRDDLPETDLGGYNFRILSCVFIGRELASYMMADEMTGDPVNDTLYISTNAVNERFNCEISYISLADAETVRETVVSTVEAGDNYFDMYACSDTRTASLAVSGYLYNLNKVEQFNYDKPWWLENINKQLEIGDRLYMGSSYLTFNGLHFTRILCANKDAFDANGLTIPYEQICNGTWYVDDLQEIIESVSRSLDGSKFRDIEHYFYGLAMGGGTHYCLQDTFGIHLYDKTKDGITLNLDYERLDTFAAKMNKLLFTNTTTAQGEEFCQKEIMSGNVLLGATQIGTVYDTIREAVDFRFGILPYPKLDELQESYYNTCTDALWGIPKTMGADEKIIGTIGTVIEGLSCENYNRVLPVYFESMLKSRLADTPDDSKMYDIIISTRQIGFEYPLRVTFFNLAGTLCRSKSISSLLKRQETMAQSFVDDLYESVMKIDD